MSGPNDGSPRPGKTKGKELYSHHASAMLCMVDYEQEAYTALVSRLPPQLASLTAEIMALLTSARIRELTRRQEALEPECQGTVLSILVAAEEDETDAWVIDRHLGERALNDKHINKMCDKATESSKEHRRLHTLVMRLNDQIMKLLGALFFRTQGGCLEMGQFAEVKQLYDALVEIYSLEVDYSSTSSRISQLVASNCHLGAEVQGRIIARLCSPRSAVRPDKAKLSFRVNYLKRCQQISGIGARGAESYREKAAVEREMLTHYKKIQRLLETAVRVQEMAGSSV